MSNQQTTTPHRNGLLFLCAGNGARSLMAEAFARFIGPAEMEYFSAGVAPISEIHPHAVKAMREVGVDISEQQLKTIDAVPMEAISTIISLCEQDECPPLPEGIHHLSWPLPDPLQQTDMDEGGLQAFRRVRDQIRELVSRLF